MPDSTQTKWKTRRTHPQNSPKNLQRTPRATTKIDEYLEGKREKPPPWKKQAKRNRTATEKAAAKAAKRAVAEAEAAATAEDETSAREEKQEVYYFGYDSAGASEPPSVRGECSSEHNEEEYLQDSFIYSRESTHHRGYRERHEDPQEHHGHSVAIEERPGYPRATVIRRSSADWCVRIFQRGARTIAPVPHQRRTMVGGNNGEYTSPRASHPQVVL